ncbi:organic cation transporter protein-like [Liolophura sinensis]|uniref:organic cation transporter protein-like n=1 Tax=Liolophura sinensis TaxID=3198878 RepID=UPI003158E4A7
MTSQSHINPTPNTSVDTAYHKTCVGLTDLINGTVAETGRCDSGYDYAQPKYTTLVTEWDLVCDKSYQAQLTQTVLVIGQGFGATFFTSLADRFGRKKLCLISQWIMLFAIVGTTFAPSILVFTLIRFVLGAVQQKFHLNRFMDESLRWLLANGRTEEARRVIDKAAKMNGIHPDDIKDVAEECLSESITLHSSQINENKHTDNRNQKSNLLDIFRHRKLRKTAFLMCFAWIVNAGTAFGLSLTAAKMSGERFLNYFLISVVSLPAGVASYIMMQRIGRRTTCIVSHFIAGSTLLSAALVNTYLGPSGWVTGLTVVGKFGISMSWGTLFQYTPELYPTNLRSVGLGIASSSSRIGGMLAPFATIVIDYYPWLPGTIYGTCCLGVGFLLFLLEETVDKELPQTIEEVNSWDKKRTTERSI